jgi:hypothetical protein
MYKVDKHIFLTGFEVQIQNTYQLSVYLPTNDSRLAAILKNKDKELYFVVYDPRVRWVGTFTPNTWYLFPNPFFIGKVSTLNYTHLKFNWRYKYKKENPSKELTKEEVDSFRRNLCL